MVPVTFLNDYGLHDDFAGVCHGAARHSVRSGAIMLARALDYMPAGDLDARAQLTAA